MTEEQDQTRPCRPGDVLAQAQVPCGAHYEALVIQPPEHPATGETSDHDVRVRLLVYLPTDRTEHPPDQILAVFRTGAQVMGQELYGRWGDWTYTRTERHRFRDFAGPAIAPLVADACRDGDEALRTVQAIVDAHAASRAAQRSARDAAYAAWPVRL